MFSQLLCLGLVTGGWFLRMARGGRRFGTRIEYDGYESTIYLVLLISSGWGSVRYGMYTWPMYEMTLSAIPLVADTRLLHICSI